MNANSRPPELGLRPVEVTDYPILFQWYGDAQVPHFWNFRRRILTYRDFLEQLGQMIRSTQLQVVCELPTRQPIGYFQAYGLRPADGWTYFTIYLSPRHRHVSEVIRTATLGLAMLFLGYPLRKVYSEVYGFSPYLRTALETMGFVEEGVTPNDYWFNGQAWTRLRLAFYREQWQELRAGTHDATV